MNDLNEVLKLLEEKDLTVKPVRDKMYATQEFPNPKNKTHVLSFLLYFYFYYYSRNINERAVYSCPGINALKRKIYRKRDCGKVFNELKSKLIKESIFVYSSVHKKILFKRMLVCMV